MKTIILTAMTLVALKTFASGGHFHPKQVAKCAKECTEQQVKDAVPAAITYLAKWDKITNSWSSAKIDSAIKKDFKKGPEWVVTLVDSTIQDTAKQKRYIFMSLDGYVTGSNSTGE
jgi:hypothetical protein